MAKTSLSLNMMFLACNYGSVPLIIFGSLRAISLADLTFEWLLVKDVKACKGNHPQNGRTDCPELLEPQNCWFNGGKGRLTDIVMIYLMTNMETWDLDQSCT